MMRQNVEQPYTSTFITLATKFTGKFTRWLSTDYRYTSFGTLSESLYSFKIRPRNIIIKMQIKI